MKWCIQVHQRPLGGLFSHLIVQLLLHLLFSTKVFFKVFLSTEVRQAVLPLKFIEMWNVKEMSAPFWSIFNQLNSDCSQSPQQCCH